MKPTYVWSLSLLLTAACSNGGYPEQGTSTDDATALVLRVPSNHLTDVSTRTARNAVCSLESGGQDSQGQVIYADDHGIVHFSIMPTLSTDLSLMQQFVLSCQTQDGRFDRRSVQVSIDNENPSSAAEIAVPDLDEPDDVVRPALEGDPMHLAQEELIAKGYPLRPNPIEAPAEYAQWLRIVSKPSRRVSATFTTTHVNGPARRQGTPFGNVINSSAMGSENWSGFVLDQSGAQYDYVQGAWTVPRVLPPTSGTTAHYHNIWIGLDGWTTSDVVQAGTAAQATHGSSWIVTYHSWIEYAPNSEIAISSLPVAPFDQIFSQVFISDGTGNNGINISGGGAQFYIDDQTTGRFYSGTLMRPSSAPAFSGTSAEWIVERQIVGSTLPPLADYQTATMTSIDALSNADGNGVLHNLLTSDASINVSMFSGIFGGHVLSKVVQATSFGHLLNQAFYTWVTDQ
jgi:Peptidase A4 family